MANFCKIPAFMNADLLNGNIVEDTENLSYEWHVKWEHISFTNTLKSPKFHFAGVQWHFCLIFEKSGDGGSLMLKNDGSKIKVLCDLCTLGMANRSNNIFKEIKRTHILDCEPSLQITLEDCFLGDVVTTFFCKFHPPKRNCKANTTTQTYPKTAYVSGHERDEEASNTCDLEGKNFLTKSISDMFIQQKNCDVIFRIGQKEFKAHKFILSAWSTVFSAMFEDDMTERKSGIVDIEDCDADAFHDFLYYLYYINTKRINKENVVHLGYIAHKYHVRTLEHQCVRLMAENLSVDCFCDVLTYALKYHEMELVKSAENFFVKNAPKILVEPRWQLFFKENNTAANELFIKYTKIFSQ